MDYSFAVCMLVQDGEISSEDVEIYEEKIQIAYKNYFLERFGIELYGKCPNCSEGKMLVKESIYGTFMGCDSFPRCKTIFKDRNK